MKTDNAIIAEFMGGIYYPKGDCWEFPVRMGVIGGAMKCNPVHIRYDTSWDWLMPVVEKIDQMKPLAMDRQSSFLRVEYSRVLGLPINSSIQKVYGFVVEFIKWYNSQPSTN